MKRVSLHAKLCGSALALLLLAGCGSSDHSDAMMDDQAMSEMMMDDGLGGEDILMNDPASEEETAMVDDSGLPEIPGGTYEDFILSAGDRSFFETDKSELSDDARETLERQAAWLNLYPSIDITIEGHADERGTRDYNLALGERRANSVKNFLIALGVDPARIGVVSYGKERPVALCSDESCWSQNRRAVTILLNPVEL